MVASAARLSRPMLVGLVCALAVHGLLATSLGGSIRWATPGGEQDVLVMLFMSVIFNMCCAVYGLLFKSAGAIAPLGLLTWFLSVYFLYGFFYMLAKGPTFMSVESWRHTLVFNILFSFFLSWQSLMIFRAFKIYHRAANTHVSLENFLVKLLEISGSYSKKVDDASVIV